MSINQFDGRDEIFFENFFSPRRSRTWDAGRESA